MGASVATVAVGNVFWTCVILPSCLTPKIFLHDNCSPPAQTSPLFSTDSICFIEPSVGKHRLPQTQTQTSVQPAVLLRIQPYFLTCLLSPKVSRRHTSGKNKTVPLHSFCFLLMCFSIFPDFTSSFHLECIYRIFFQDNCTHPSLVLQELSDDPG